MFETETFRRAYRIVLESLPRAEAEATAARIVDGDADSWLREWTETGGAAWAAARRSGDPALYLRAGACYAATLPVVRASSEPGLEHDLWQRQRTCWDRAVALSGGERIALPYEGTTLPGYRFRAEGAARRPLLVVNHGGLGGTAVTLNLVAAAAAERGWHWVAFDGPGQQAALREQGLTLRPDWEHVLTPVLDAVLADDGVDRDRVAAIGVGQAGLWLARATAFEQRLAAAVLCPGIVDLSTAWTGRLPAPAVAALARGAAAEFDRELRIAELFAPLDAAALHHYGVAHGRAGSRFALFQRVAAYRLGDELAQIRTPLLACPGDGWPGQAAALVARLPGVAELGRPDTDVFAWLDRYLR